MKKIMFIIIYFLVPYLNFSKSNIKVTISNIKSNDGLLRLGIFKKNDEFPNSEKASFNKVFKLNGKEIMNFELIDIPYGEYAIAVHHDLNNNGKLETNWLGIPNEPYGFSGKSPGFSPPEFENHKILINENYNHIIINLK